MNKRIIASLIAFSFSGISLLALAAGPPPDATGGAMAMAASR